MRDIENQRKVTFQEVDQEDIKYHHLIMGIERGSRILINDNETETINRAFAFNVTWNKGFTGSQIEEFNEIITN